MIGAAEIHTAKILIVDDQEVNVRLLDRMLRGDGYTSIASTLDPRAVCAMHAKHHYDLILLDVEMPGMNGFQVMEDLKEVEKDGYLPVLVITARPEHKLRALQAGAKDFVSKPLDIVEVLTRVYNLLEVRLLYGETQRLCEQVLAEQNAQQRLTHALQEAQMERRYRGLLEAAPDAMVVVDEGGTIVLLNAQAEKQFGYPRDELVGRKVKDIIPEGFAERLIADGTRTAAAALAQQMGTGIELTGRRKNGSEFPLELMLSPLENDDGVLVTAAIRDISVRKAAEQQLARMEGRYRGLLEAAPDAMVVVNPRGEIVLLNVRAEKQFGYPRDELVGRKVKDIIPEGFAERLIADGTRTATEALAQQIGTGIELAGRRKDGTVFPLELMLSPLESAEGALVTAAIRDITARIAAAAHLVDRKIMEEALFEEKERVQVTLDSIGDAVLSTDAAGNVTYLNAIAELLTGWSGDEARGRPLDEVFRVVDGATRAPPARNPMRLAIDRNRPVGLAANSILVRRDGFETAIEDSAAPIHGRDGSVIGAVLVFHDVSEARAVALKVSHLAQHDFLTDLPNPVLLNDRITQAIAMARRRQQQLAVLFLDLDHFKRVNDTLGHAAGDKLLQSIAQRLQECVRGSDTVSRKGGDEFVVLLSEIAHAEHAARSAEKIMAAVTASHAVGGEALVVTASIGIAIYPLDGTDAETLIKSADTAMYQAKQNGRNHFSFSSSAMNPGTVERQPVADAALAAR